MTENDENVTRIELNQMEPSCPLAPPPSPPYLTHFVPFDWRLYNSYPFSWSARRPFHAELL